ncbi:hypothetical protein ACUNV4_29605 [Granulosicoccus sp. 3-233]|uniref:hypothetical protein n=1 Tax=Granulosicoccus sp. 3-233 TaxID=3417969 RepID=UPI003D3256F6
MTPRISAISLCYYLLFVTLPALAAVETTEPPSFTAIHRLWHEPSDTVLDEARLVYSQWGLRAEQLADDSGNVFIANHAEDAFWFLDRKRRLVHEIPVVVSDSSAEEGESDVAGPPIAGARPGPPESAPGVLSVVQLEPCKGMVKVSLGDSVFQGRDVHRWSCLIDGERFEEHWFAADPGVVVRMASRDGFVRELTEIHERHASAAYFRPPSHYRSVEIEELINPAVPISSYVEKKIGQP